MSGVISTALKHLIAAGMSGDDLVRAVAEMEEAQALAPAPVDAAAERRRQKDREYQAARRAERRQDRQDRQISADSSDGPDAAPNDIYSNPPVPPVEAKASTAPRGRSDRGSKIPEGWQPPAIADLPDEARAMAQRWPASAYRAEAEAFRNYWLGESSAKARKSNWNRAWANRIVAVNSKVLRDAKFSGAGTNTVGRSNGAPMTASQLRSAIAYAEDNNNPDRAAELKAQLERMTARQPPGEIGAIVRQAAGSVRANVA